VAERRLSRSLTAQEVSAQLDGLVSPKVLTRWAREGRVPGAFKLGHRTFFAHNTALWLVQDLSTMGGAGYAITVPRDGSQNGLVRPAAH